MRASTAAVLFIASTAYGFAPATVRTPVSLWCGKLGMVFARLGIGNWCYADDWLFRLLIIDSHRPSSWLDIWYVWLPAAIILSVRLIHHVWTPLPLDILYSNQITLIYLSRSFTMLSAPNPLLPYQARDQMCQWKWQSLPLLWKW